MIENIKKNHLYVGRGSTAIYLILKTNMNKKEVILPANICYAAIYPVIYSDNIPVFVDINKKTNNMDFDEIIKRITPNTGAIIYPYMYGNVDCDILKIKEYCNDHDILLIEDCASAMGANINGIPVGSIGDYSVFSTGHAKIVDVGNGGLILSDKSLLPIEEIYNSLNLFNEEIENKIQSFSKTYRVLRNEDDLDGQKKFFSKDYKELFIYKINDNLIRNIKDGIKQLPNIIDDRNDKYNLFVKSLNKSNHFEIMQLGEGSVAWRFSIIVYDVLERKELIDKILNNNLFISDWYPNLGKIFSNDNYPNADYIEKRVLNLSIMDLNENIIKVCNIINDYFDSKTRGEL